MSKKYFGVKEDGTRVEVKPTVQEDGSLALKDAGYIKIEEENE